MPLLYSVDRGHLFQMIILSLSTSLSLSLSYIKGQYNKSSKDNAINLGLRKKKKNFFFPPSNTSVNTETFPCKQLFRGKKKKVKERKGVLLTYFQEFHQ